MLKNVILFINHACRNDKQQLNNAIVKPVKTSNHLACYAIDFNIKHNGQKYFSEQLKRNNLTKLPKEI